MTVTLLERLKNREQQAQQELRNRLFSRILAICTHMMGDRSLAEETAEDIWMDFIYQHIDKVRKERAVGAYLRMMTIRRCVRLREWQHRHDELKDQTPLTTGSESATVERMDRLRKMDRLAFCLNRFTKRIRHILRMRYYNEMTQEAIGHNLGVSKQYVGRVIAKSLEKLRVCMEEAP